MLFEHFPTTWQAVVFRNYGKVPTDRIAVALKTSEETIHNAARDLGLGSFNYQANWESKGYITTVRNNWHLLSIPQILSLLNISRKRFESMLADEDFLWVKLGEKPEIVETVFTPLSQEAVERTARIRTVVEKNIIQRQETYFDFYSKFKMSKAVLADSAEPLRVVHNYCLSDPDFLLNGDFSEYPPQYLSELRNCGINGLWFHGLLVKFIDKAPDTVCDGYHEIRLKNLKKFTEYLAGYGIKAYMYLNEPRSLCTSRPDVKAYLYEGVRRIVKAAPDLGGIITITMSENQTNCYSKIHPKDIACPLCKDRTPDDVVAEINNIFYKAIRDAGSRARLIAWNWGFNDFMNWQSEWQENAICRLDEGIDVMCVSEEALEIEKGGIKNKIIDYSVSNPGPSERTKKIWELAQKSKHNAIAKIQAANSWELAAVPYLPVFEILEKHLQGIKVSGITDIMLGWTLGGGPSPNLKFAKAFLEGKTLDDWYINEYGSHSESVKNACKLFSQAFEEFPFCLNFVYNGPQNFGCANLFYAKSTGLKSTMVGYPFDDIDGWRSNYPKEVLLSQLKKLSDGWAKGMKILESVKVRNATFDELETIAGAAGCHFMSAYLITEWILTKNKTLLKKEYENTRKLLQYSSQDARIGFEASNHYLYNENNLLEKLINLKFLEESI